MISILILVGICLTADAKPNPVVGSYVVDGVQGVLYEVPEYEDPELALLQLSALGVMPVLTLLHDADSLDGEDSCIEEFADVKKGLDGIIVGLEDAKNKFEEGSTDIENDIGKSITHLMKLKHHLQTHINHAISVDRKSGVSYKDGQERIPHAEESSTQASTTTEGSDVNDGDHEDIAKIMTIADAIMVSEPGEKSVNGFLKYKQPLHKLNDPLASDHKDPSETYGDNQELSETYDVDNQEASETYDVDNQEPSETYVNNQEPSETYVNKQEPSETYEDNHEISILESQKIPNQVTTSSEMSDTDDSKPELVEMKTVEEGIVVSGKKKYQDVGKAVVHRKKWSWKPSKEDE